ncbi:uncharacterized protein LOC116431728 [Nomia melanderi]|uniref:uncharacterized protein LOC116431728 n=1 Tax=Nomia melanderi TaxID=2448451 RepID=UPI003FCC340A
MCFYQNLSHPWCRNIDRCSITGRTVIRVSLISAIVAVLIFLLMNFWLILHKPKVQIKEGYVQGIMMETRNGRQIFAFLGIPYAEPPLGNLRFRSPVPKKAWRGTLKAHKEGRLCLQYVANKVVVGQENCLTMNVYSPKLKGTVLLPVMVFTHDGGFMRGNSSDHYFGPDYLLDKDIVLVTHNYRLGPFGFLSTGDAAAPGNFGLKDQLLVLKWVQRNIRAFGGDPKKVTLAGQNMGSVCVHIHALSNKSEHMFSRVIMQGGLVSQAFSFHHDPLYFDAAKRLGGKNNCPTNDSYSLVNCLRRLTASKVMETSLVFTHVQELLNAGWGPVVEPQSEDALLTESPTSLIEKCELKRSPYIIGSRRNEAISVVKALYSNETLYKFLANDPLSLMAEVLQDIYFLKDRNTTHIAIEARNYYLGTEMLNRSEQISHGIGQFLTDVIMFYPVTRYLKHVTEVCGHKVYNYLFNYGDTFSELYLQDNKTWDDDLIYLFPQKLEPVNLTYKFEPTVADHNISELMVDLWTSFVITGIPTSTLLSYPTLWKTYENNNSFLQIVIDKSGKREQKHERQKNFNGASDYFSRSNLVEDKENEVNFTMKSRSISHLQENISRDALSRCSSNGTYEISLSNDSNIDEVFMSDDKSVSFGSKRTKNQSNQLEERTGSFVNRRMSGDKIIEDALFSCPFELVEIYPGNKENIDNLDQISSDLNQRRSSMRSFPKEDNESSKSVFFEENVPPLRKIASKQMKKEMYIVENENAKCGKNNRDVEKNIYESFLSVQTIKGDLQEKNVSTNVKNFNGTCKLNIDRSMNSITSNGAKRSYIDGKEMDLSKECSQNRFLEKPVDSKDSLAQNITKKEHAFAIENNSAILESRKTCANDETKFAACAECDETSKKEVNLIGIKKKDLNVTIDTHDEYFVNSSTSRNIEYTNGSSKNIKNSDADSLIIDEAMIDTRKRKSNFEMESVNKNKNLKIITKMEEKQEESLNNNRSCNEKKGLLQVDSRQNEGNQNSKQKTTEYVIDDFGDGIREKNKTDDNNRGNIKICDLLMKIHEQLFINFQKMESIWIKLQSRGSIDSVRSTMALCLLTRIISRCKSYIHDSNDNYKAEAMITRSLSNLIFQLVKAVDQNQILLKKQEQQINSMQLKWRQERNLYEKRRITNEVVSFWDHGLNKICDIMQVISNMLKTIIAENKEKENLRNLSYRQKSGVAEAKGLKANFSKKESNVETEVFKNSVLKRPKSKACMKSICTQKYREKENLVDGQNKTIERKLNDNVRCPEKGKLFKKPTQSMNFKRLKQPVSRQKCRAVNNLQPVWRPGGAIKFPSLSNVTVFPQKSRLLFTQVNERLNQPMENMKEVKRGKIGELKKKVSAETCSVKFMNPETTSKFKLKPGILKVSSKKHKDSSRSESPSSKNSEKAPSLERVTRQNPSRESKVLQKLKEIIKSTPTDEKAERSTNKSTDHYEYRTKTNSTSIKEQVKIPEEEPTRDIDSNQIIKSQSKDEMFRKRQHLNEEISHLPTAVITSTNSVSSSITNDNEDTHSKSSFPLEKSQLKNNCNFPSATNTSCTANFTSSSDYITRLVSSKCCSTSPGIISPLSTIKQKKIQESSYSELHTPNFIEDKINDLVIKEKLKKSLVANEERSISTSQVMSLTMLKEFLCEQGVDINLVNTAERYMKNKQKYRNCLKKKSASLADVIFNIQPIKGSEISLKNSNYQERTSKEIVKNYENSKDCTDLEDTARKIAQHYKTSLTYSIPQTKDTFTFCEEKINKDASSQTRLHETENKGIQVVFEEDTPLATKQRTMKTQTEMASVKHAAIDCCIKNKNTTRFTDKSNNASSMTDSVSVTDSFTQVVQVSCASKLVATEWSNLPKKLEQSFEKNSTDIIINTSNEIYSESIKLEGKQHSKTKHCKKFLNQMEECSDVFLSNCEQHDDDYELHFHELTPSSHLKQSSEYLKNSDCHVKIDAKLNNLDKLISNETLAALQSASIQVENLYKAIYIYQKHIESKLKKQEDRIQIQKARNKTSNKYEEILRSSPKSDSIDITIRDSCHSGKDIVNILSRLEIASSSDESEYEISRSVSTPIVNIYNEQSTKDGSKESSTVLKDVKSLMELLIQKMDNKKTQRIRCIERVSSKTCSNIHIKISKVEDKKTENCFSIFSRQSLLPFIYGIVCFVVFWCLHFTIVCDIVT